MVPLMMGTLAVVVATQWSTVREFGSDLAWLVPVYLGFVLLMVFLALVIAQRPGLEIIPAAVLEQTLVELVVMVTLVAVFNRPRRAMRR